MKNGSGENLIFIQCVSRGGRMMGRRRYSFLAPHERRAKLTNSQGQRRSFPMQKFCFYYFSCFQFLNPPSHFSPSRIRFSLLPWTCISNVIASSELANVNNVQICLINFYLMWKAANLKCTSGIWLITILEMLLRMLFNPSNSFVR